MKTEQKNAGDNLTISEILARLAAISEYIEDIKNNTADCLQEIQDQMDMLTHKNSRVFYEASEELYTVIEELQEIYKKK